MSRSRRKTAIIGVTAAPCDKPFKVDEHRAERHGALSDPRITAWYKSGQSEICVGIRRHVCARFCYFLMRKEDSNF